MDLPALALFAGALVIAAASPGPGVAALVARVLARGRAGAIAFTAGLAVGDVVWLGAAIAGLSALAQTFGAVFVAVKYAGAAYLLFLAWKLWTSPAPTAGPGEPPAAERPLRLFAAGLAVTLGNPKVMVFYLALLPSLVEVTSVGLLGFAELAAVTLGILALVFGLYIGLALRARRFLTSPRAVRAVNRATGTVMAGAAVAIAAR
ncbi:MAG: LysE family translocator [Methylobacteriaceae bacterium]|nr:LysE family translocator [Methylobacteriaceae bacterium]